MWNSTQTNSSSVVVLQVFGQWYANIHGYLSVVVITFGITSNIMNMIVLTRPPMQTPTNYLLTALALTDAMTMASYLPNAIYFYCISSLDPEGNHPEGWVVYFLTGTNLVITFHTIAMWLTVALAVFRYVAVTYHTLGKRYCNMQRARITVIIVYTVTIVCCVPNYVIYKAAPRVNGSGYWFVVNSFLPTFHQTFNFWLFGVVLKILPCVLLFVLSSLLMRTMRKADQKHRRLKSHGSTSGTAAKTNEHNRTTAMLVAVVLCFVITEFPQGVLALLSGLSEFIFHKVYSQLGDVWDIIVLINSSVNFILYCIMSKQFREIFQRIFLRWLPTKRPESAYLLKCNEKENNVANL